MTEEDVPMVCSLRTAFLREDVSTGNYAGSENLGPLTTSGNADDGEYLKIDLGSTVQATTLTLKWLILYRLLIPENSLRYISPRSGY